VVMEVCGGGEGGGGDVAVGGDAEADGLGAACGGQVGLGEFAVRGGVVGQRRLDHVLGRGNDVDLRGRQGDVAEYPLHVGDGHARITGRERITNDAEYLGLGAARCALFPSSMRFFVALDASSDHVTQQK
jgi:hypothetical protein